MNKTALQKTLRDPLIWAVALWGVAVAAACALTGQTTITFVWAVVWTAIVTGLATHTYMSNAARLRGETLVARMGEEAERMERQARAATRQDAA